MVSFLPFANNGVPRPRWADIFSSDSESETCISPSPAAERRESEWKGDLGGKKENVGKGGQWRGKGWWGYENTMRTSPMENTTRSSSITSSNEDKTPTPRRHPSSSSQEKTPRKSIQSEESRLKHTNDEIELLREMLRQERTKNERFVDEREKSRQFQGEQEQSIRSEREKIRSLEQRLKEAEERGSTRVEEENITRLEKENITSLEQLLKDQRARNAILQKTLTEERERNADQNANWLSFFDTESARYEALQAKFDSEEASWHRERTRLEEEKKEAEARAQKNISQTNNAIFECENMLQRNMTEKLQKAKARLEEENRGLRERLECYVTNLKNTRKEHNVHVQKLQRKLDAALARFSNKKVKTVGTVTETPQTSEEEKLREVNRLLLERLVIKEHRLEGVERAIQAHCREPLHKFII